MASTDIGDIVASISADVKTIVQGEIQLAKAEIVPQIKKAATGSAMFAAAGYLAFCAFGLIGMGVAFLFGWIFTTYAQLSVLMSVFLGFMCSAVLALIIAGIVALIGQAQMKFHGPTKTIAEAKQTTDDVKTAIAQGKLDVATGAALEPVAGQTLTR